LTPQTSSQYIDVGPENAAGNRIQLRPVAREGIGRGAGTAN